MDPGLPNVPLGSTSEHMQGIMRGMDGAAVAPRTSLTLRASRSTEADVPGVTGLVGKFPPGFLFRLFRFEARGENPGA